MIYFVNSMDTYNPSNTFAIQISISDEEDTHIIGNSGGDSSGVANRFAGACDPPLSDAGGQHAGVRLVRGRVLHHRLLLPRCAHRRVHRVRRTHQEDTRGLQ